MTYLNNLPLSSGISSILMPINLFSQGHKRVHWNPVRGAIGVRRAFLSIKGAFEILGASILFHIL